MLGFAFIPFFGAFIVFGFTFYYNYKACQNFGLGTLGCVLGGLFGVWVYWYIVLTNKPFVGQLDPKYTNNHINTVNYN